MKQRVKIIEQVKILRGLMAKHVAVNNSAKATKPRAVLKMPNTAALLERETGHESEIVCSSFNCKRVLFLIHTLGQLRPSLLCRYPTSILDHSISIYKQSGCNSKGMGREKREGNEPHSNYEWSEGSDRTYALHW